MLLTTPEELRQYHPSHLLENLDGLRGIIHNSERSILIEKIGESLYAKITEYYEGLSDPDSILPGGNSASPMEELLHLCQAPIAFDTLYRAADVQSISLNASGLNILSTDGYESAKEDSIDRFKNRMYKEAHDAIDLLLATLEEWAKEVGKFAEDAELTDDQKEKKAIVSLWKESIFFYLVDGLFLNTARKFNEYVNIYENREKFIQLLPDLRYCQDITIRLELGDELTDDLLEKMRTNKANKAEARTVINLQRTLALHVEARNAMFKRKEAKDEAIFNMKLTLDYIRKHQDEFDQSAIKSAPFYEEPKQEEEETQLEEGKIIGLPADYTTPRPQTWKNNKRGNAIFVTKAIE